MCTTGSRLLLHLAQLSCVADGQIDVTEVREDNCYDDRFFLTPRYLQDLRHQIGGKLTQLTSFDIEAGGTDAHGVPRRRCCGAGRKCGWTGGIVATLVVIAFMTLLTLWWSAHHYAADGGPPLPPLPPVHHAS